MRKLKYKSFQKRAFLCLFFIMTTTLIAHAQAIIKGTVLDDSGHALSSVVVKVTDSIGQQTLSTETNEKGLFSFEGLTAGRCYDFYFAHSGYLADSLPDFLIKRKDNNSVLIRLRPADKKSSHVVGIVRDSLGNGVGGVSISVADGTTGAVTSASGYYSLEAPIGSEITFRYIGFASRSLLVDPAKDSLNVILIPEKNELNDIVVVGYGTQRRGNLTGSISTVESADLTVAPTASTINSMAGRLPGLISQQSSGQPGQDQATISIRGYGQAIWIVDGIEADFNTIDPNQIESISILKDGSASIYGARAGNGVILVTTKRGMVGKPIISLNSSYTLQGNTAMAKPVNSGQYAEIENEIYTNQGKQAPYTDEQIQKFYGGTDPQYPNTNWYEVATRPWAPQNQQNLSVRGGNDKIKYFGFLGYLNQSTMWQSNGGYYKRYNVQSNTDIKITDDLSVQLNLIALSEQKKYPNRSQSAGINTLWQDLWNSLPIYPSSLPDPTKYSYANGQGVGSIKLISDYDIAGYDQVDHQNLRATFIANYKIRAVEGLSAKLFINYDKTYTNDKNFSKPYDFYTYDYDTKIYTQAGSLGTQAKLTLQNTQAQNMTGQFSLNYDHVFNSDHHFTAMALYEAIDYSTNFILAGRDNFLTPAIEQLYAGSVETSQANSSATEMGRASYVFRMTYGYKNKYLLESTLRADASAKFPPEKRWGYFPSISLGWRLDQEKFLKRHGDIDLLKLRASYGSSGYDNVGNFQYLSGYQIDGYWLFNNNTSPGLGSKGLANPNLTWESIDIYNLGADFSLWNRKLYGTFEVFYRTLSGIPSTRQLTLPSTFGSALPPENLNSQNNRGFELSLGTSGQIENLSYEFSGNLSWSRAKWDHYEQQDYTDPDQRRIYQLSGRWTDIEYGYKSDGLFTSQQEIDHLDFNYPAGNASLQKGDIKYVDVNGDGKLDYRDEVEIGQGTVPHWMVGGTLNLKYKQFDLQSLFQGAFGYYNYILLQQGGINFSEVLYKLRWSEENNVADAFVPRLSGAASNNLPSDHPYKKAGYLRLKTIAIGYNLPKRVLDKMGFQALRVYLAGTNLITMNKLKDYGVDPEAPSGEAAYYYPQQRTVSIGVNLTF